MCEIISDFKDEVRIITPKDDYHYFFAYYDIKNSWVVLTKFVYYLI